MVPGSRCESAHSSKRLYISCKYIFIYILYLQHSIHIRTSGVCNSVYIYIHMCIRMCTYFRVYLHVNLYIYIYSEAIFLPLSISSCIYIHIYDVYINIRIYIHIYICVYVCNRLSLYMCTRISALIWGYHVYQGTDSKQKKTTPLSRTGTQILSVPTYHLQAE